MLMPFFSYYGSKWRLAGRYPPPEYGTIIEPFAGSACYALHYPSRDVLLIDKYENIVGVWQYLIGVSREEILALPDVPEGGSTADLDVCEEARWLMGFWLGQGVNHPYGRTTKWTQASHNTWNARARRRVARQLDAIRHWRVVLGDYTDAPDIAATWFVDPPYQEKGRHYVNGAQRIDFAALGEWCRCRQGQVIACENEGADWLPFERFATISSTLPGRKSREVIWTQGSNHARQGALL